MADENRPDVEETAEDAAVADGVAEFGQVDTVDEVVVTETTAVMDTVADDEEVLVVVEERVIETYPEGTVPDLEAIAGDEVVEEWQVVRSAAAVDNAAPPSEAFVVVERTEMVVREAAAEEPEEALEDFTTLQAVTLAFLVLINIIVIGLGIWQVSRYFGWL